MTATCPLCRHPLVASDQKGVTIATCDAHGLWVSQDDLSTLLRRAEAAGKRGQYSRALAAAQDGKALRPLRNRPRHHRSVVATAGAEPEVASLRPCAECGATMAIEERSDIWRQFPTVVIDRCPDHGIWLDRGELEALVQRAFADGRRVADHRVRKAYGDATDEAHERRGAGSNATMASLLGLLGDAVLPPP